MSTEDTNKLGPSPKTPVPISSLPKIPSLSRITIPPRHREEVSQTPMNSPKESTAPDTKESISQSQLDIVLEAATKRQFNNEKQRTYFLRDVREEFDLLEYPDSGYFGIFSGKIFTSSDDHDLETRLDYIYHGMVDPNDWGSSDDGGHVSESQIKPEPESVDSVDSDEPVEPVKTVDKQVEYESFGNQ